jgi:hypothetical protein
VNYLQRAAHRLALDPTPGVRPAMPSHSPLAEADQRLNLDSFAERITAGVVPERAAPTSDHEQAATAPDAGRQPEKRHRKTPAAAANLPTPPAPPTRSEPTTMETMGQSRQNSAVASARPDSHGPPDARRPEHGDPDAPAAASTTSDRAVRRANAGPAPPAGDVRAAAPGHTRSASVNVTADAAPPTHDQATQPVLDTLSRAIAWVEGQPRPSPTQEPGGEHDRPAVVALPPAGRTSPMRPAAPAAARERAAGTHLDIGRIEIEIVPPKPASPAPSQRPAPTTRGPSRALRQPFGWRQR